MNKLEYKGYIGSIQYSETDGIFFGRVQGIRSLVSYEGRNEQELVEDFHEAVDAYLALCEAESKGNLIKPYKGHCKVRLHKPEAFSKEALMR